MFKRIFFQFTPKLHDSQTIEKATEDASSEHARLKVTSPGPYAVNQEQQGGFSPMVEQPDSYQEKDIKTAKAKMTKSDDLKPIARRGSKKSGFKPKEEEATVLSKTGGAKALATEASSSQEQGLPTATNIAVAIGEADLGQTASNLDKSVHIGLEESHTVTIEQQSKQKAAKEEKVVGVRFLICLLNE